MRLHYADQLGACAMFGTERVGFPMTNVQHPFLVKRWRSLTANTEALLFDPGVGNTLDVSTAFIVQHNLMSASVTHVQMNDVDDWLAPPVDVTVTWDEGIIAVDLGGLQSRRYMRFTFDDPTNSAGYVEIGRLLVNAPLVLATRLEGVELSPLDLTEESEARSGQVYADTVPARLQYVVPFKNITVAERDALLSMYVVTGRHEPLIVEPDELDHMNFPLVYARLLNTPAFRHEGASYWTLKEPLTFEEVF